MSKADIRSDRLAHLGRSLTLHYEKDDPLLIVKGKGTYLYDEQGNQYLDCVNNVAHVGHCNEHVVRAASKQLAELNTNTRYLHPNIVKYAKMLTSTLPEALSVCFFVCSGSEANDLALRLARTHTGHEDVVVLDGAYHGSLISLVEISPYKYEGKGGFDRKAHVHKAIMPDSFRGEYKKSDPEAGVKYAEDVRQKINESKKRGSNVAAFYAESLMGCGGQIVLPENYLKSAYQHVREAGGVCIADEVQVGFGRVGEAFWGFETQGVVPDIVTMGKPIGNGYPMAAVVTTKEIANSFHNGMDYFNTFGGATAACAVGIAVLEAIRNEKLQENALNVGTNLLKELHLLKEKYPIIGEVRGKGLFIGVELVRDALTLEPADTEAEYITCFMKREGVLVSTDGKYRNVLKIKPPLCFNAEDAGRLIRALEKAFISQQNDATRALL